jgi:hypothetical protein
MLPNEFNNFRRIEAVLKSWGHQACLPDTMSRPVKNDRFIFHSMAGLIAVGISIGMLRTAIVAQGIGNFSRYYRHDAINRYTPSGNALPIKPSSNGIGTRNVPNGVGTNQLP